MKIKMSQNIYLYLDLLGYKIREIKELKLTQAINVHSRLYISAILDESDHITPLFSTQPGTQIGLINHNREQPTIFYGMVKTIQIKHLSGVYYLELLAVSNTFLLDTKLESRSFQNRNLQYRDLIQSITNGYSASDFFYRESNQAIGAFTMQFEETDWTFLTRMASRFNTGLVPDHRFQQPKFTFGIPPGENRGTLESYNFYMKKDVSDFMISSQNWNENLTALDAIRFYIQTEEEFQIGDSVMYRDMELYVKSIEGQMLEGILLYTCELTTRNGLSQDRIFNDKITGLSLKGKVIESVQDQVRVHLEIDQEQHQDTAWNFPYTTTYTAEGSAGWYCMPEAGDTVFIYFPNKMEENAVGVNSIREHGGVDNPEIKIFRTPNGKELRFSPNEILLTCVEGSIFIRLNESSGIEIISSQPVNINSQSNVNITAMKKANISANSQISLTCNGSSMILDGMVNIDGSEVHIS